MEISGNQRPIDPATRKRQTDAANRAAARAPQSGDARPADAVELGSTSAQAIARYVDILKAMNPADLHRVEDLRARIQDGTFTATAEELAGPLSDLLDQEQLGRPQADDES
jgi:flagellar biosynthesis anti-sigma factor FlgM